jgi:hypothetical protein
MLKLTRPKDTTSSIFYVSSEAKPSETHIVVKVESLFGQACYFCDCRDFMVRRLPNLRIGGGSLTPCKHGEFVRDIIGAQRMLGRFGIGVEITGAVRG